MIEQVWPKNKVNLSESYLPAVVQVLTHFVDELEGMEVPDPPEVIHASATSAPTASAAETNVETSQSTEATVITSTESINSTESSETSSASPETPSSTSSRYVLLEEDFDEVTRSSVSCLEALLLSPAYHPVFAIKLQFA